ncbi:MAG: response regulator transcription factor [Acidobacteriota bacterium]
MKVLIVEDNKAVRHLLCSILRDLAEIFECQNGTDALHYYETLNPDWVLMDIRIPGINGIEATRRIINAHPLAQVVIVTNYDDAKLRLSAHNAGAFDYVLKENLFSLQGILTKNLHPANDHINHPDEF